jgi:alanine racemase
VALYREAVDKVSVPVPVVRHLCNSAGIFNAPREALLDACRPGIAIYGLSPLADSESGLVGQLQPILELKSKVTCVKEIPKGAGVSYGHSFVTTEKTKIGTVPIGYGDGLDRNLSNKMHVMVKGIKCRQLGRVTMDNIVIELTHVDGVKVGDEVTLIGDGISADALAALTGTINYEVTTALTHRVERFEK